MGFLPANFQLPTVFRSWLKSQARDRRTDRRRPSMHNAPPLCCRATQGLEQRSPTFVGFVVRTLDVLEAAWVAMILGLKGQESRGSKWMDVGCVLSLAAVCSTVVVNFRVSCSPTLTGRALYTAWVEPAVLAPPFACTSTATSPIRRRYTATRRFDSIYISDHRLSLLVSVSFHFRQVHPVWLLG